jgi:hypothetical protein
VRLLAALALLMFAASASAQTRPPLPSSDLAGEWHGQWTSPSGYLFTATLSLKVAPDGIADGLRVPVSKTFRDQVKQGGWLG